MYSMENQLMSMEIANLMSEDRYESNTYQLSDMFSSMVNDSQSPFMSQSRSPRYKPKKKTSSGKKSN